MSKVSTLGGIYGSVYALAAIQMNSKVTQLWKLAVVSWCGVRWPVGEEEQGQCGKLLGRRRNRGSAVNCWEGERTGGVQWTVGVEQKQGQCGEHLGRRRHSDRVIGRMNGKHYNGWLRNKKKANVRIFPKKLDLIMSSETLYHLKKLKSYRRDLYIGIKHWLLWI